MELFQLFLEQFEDQLLLWHAFSLLCYCNSGTIVETGVQGLQLHRSSPERDEKETHSLTSSLPDPMSLIVRYLYIGRFSNLKIPLHTAVQRLHMIFKRTPPITSLFKYLWTRSLVVNVNEQK